MTARGVTPVILSPKLAAFPKHHFLIRRQIERRPPTAAEKAEVALALAWRHRQVSRDCTFAAQGSSS